MSDSKINSSEIKNLRWLFSFLLIAIICLCFSQSTPAKPGDLDPAFGVNGVVLSAFGNNDVTKKVATDMAVQADGKVVVVEYACIANNCENNYVVLTRYNSDGSLDINFGVGGKVELRDFSIALFDLSPDILIQPDGKILVATSTKGRRSLDFALARFNQNGTPDLSFGANGKVSIDFDGSYDRATSIALQADGKIVIAGGRFYSIARCNPDGSLDASFGTNGKVVTSRFYPALSYYYEPDWITDLAIQSDGSILAVGRLNLPFGNIAIARYNPNGSLDTRFGNNGVVAAPGYFWITEFEAYSMAIQPDGKIVVAGNTWPHNSATTGVDFLIIRYNRDGSLDNTFGDNGIVISNISGWQSSHDRSLSLSFQSDGKILAAGITDFNTAAIARFNSDGSIDKSFNLDGRTLTDKLDCINSIAIEPNGKILAAGYKGNHSAIARFEGGSLPAKTIFDFDSDRKSDLAVWRPSNQTWYILRSSDNQLVQEQWGVSTDIPAPTDYDGDGKTDIAMFRPRAVSYYNVTYSAFYILHSSNNRLWISEFFPTIFPEQVIVGDYDGDSKADPAIFLRDSYLNSGNLLVNYAGTSNNRLEMIRPQTWLSSSTTFLTEGINVNGDFNGDGITDIVRFSPKSANWDLFLSTSLEVKSQSFGGQFGDDKPVPADYDGDGKTDLAVYRNGEWSILQSSDKSTRVEWLGNNTDIPAPADYDGDGKTDVAVYRNGEWWMKLSGSGDVVVKQFGLAGDVPIPSSHLR